MRRPPVLTAGGRCAGLGEEVRDPARTVPRAILVALGFVLVVYAAVAVTLLHVLGTHGLATSTAPVVSPAATPTRAAAPVSIAQVRFTRTVVVSRLVERAESTP